MVVVECSVPQCDFKTNDVSEALAIALLSNHGLAHQNTVPAVSTQPAPTFQGPKLERPKIDVGVSIEDWNVFVRRWEVFRTGSGINDTSAPYQLFQCAGTDLARVRGKAETCAFTAECECGKDVDYTDNVIRDVLLNGLSDPDIRREILGTPDILKKPVNDVIALVENKEMARNALPSSTLSAVSSFQRQKNPTTTTATTPSQVDQTKEATCPDCKHTFKVFTEGARGWNTKPHQLCINCYRTRRRKKRQPRLPHDNKPSLQAIEQDPISQVAVFQTAQTDRHRRHHTRASTPHGNINKALATRLDHHIFSKGEWKRARLLDHPRVKVTISVAKSADTRITSPSHASGRDTVVSAVADTGAQSDLWSLADFLACGFSRDELRPVSLSLSAANRSPISIEGAFFAKITSTPHNGNVMSCHSMVYVSSSVQAMYLSYETLLNLGLLANDFPSMDNVGTPSERTQIADSDASPDPASINAARSLNNGCNAPNTPHDPCSCPQREVAPPSPPVLPFPCTPENNDRMKAWLLARYSSSTFNTCPHRALPCMEGPSIEMHVDATATPKACHTPANIPLHWQQQVHDDLLRDEALGVIERVPYGEPVKWCHRMVVTRKHDGSPRRTVDLSPLNKFCKRETFAMESPSHLARRIPKETWKTVTDAWNGYHSVPLRESSYHLHHAIWPLALPESTPGFPIIRGWIQSPF
ncbi:Hypothetical predicted protein [Paramuricea clavata]|uniref:Uncharacterized protein n=1 Tax=Paramuricea clavata TaxID=317549 RepID=A0A7D9JTY1_PARCT|nr:Hypothetical predicted protein [Paramuricea clavata]